MKIKNQKDIWNIIADSWKDYRQKPLPEVESFLKNKGGNILDLGCGSGRHFLSLKNTTLYGVDFSKSMLKHAEAKAQSLKIPHEIICAPTYKLPLEDNYFDRAIFIATLHCIPSPSNRRKSLEELYRILKPNAQALITVWSKNHDRIKKTIKDQIIPWTVKGTKYERYYYIYDKEEIQSILKKVGFKIINIEENDNLVVEVKK